VPSGLAQLSDMGSIVQRATLVMQQGLTNPLVAQNQEVQRILWEGYLRALKMTNLQKILAATDRGIQAQLQAQRIELAAHAAMGGGQVPPPGGPGGPGGGGAPQQPPGTIGGPPAPLPSPPELPPGSTAQNVLPPPEAGTGSPG